MSFEMDSVIKQFEDIINMLYCACSMDIGEGIEIYTLSH